MKPILEIKDISKKFHIHHEHQSYLSIRDNIASAFKKKTKRGDEDFWALKNVSFNVEQGESIGIIGKNGAGKSTLLKILSKITPPTSGKIISRGRIASLLEVGTGFHGELSGRENIFLNGSILGMRKNEIEKKFDEIVDFSGVEKFIDTPIKHYSSGMQLRLAFAVAAFLEPEILLIDEVLAVGDAEFQRKCLGKMDEVSKSGRTVLFVSHNMNSISQLCLKSILLKEGSIAFYGDTNAIINQYLIEEIGSQYTNEAPSKDIFIKSAYFVNDRNEIINNFINGAPVTINVEIINRKKSRLLLDIAFFDEMKRVLWVFNMQDINVGELPDKENVKLNIKFFPPKTNTGTINIDLGLREKNKDGYIDHIISAVQYKILEDGETRKYNQFAPIFCNSIINIQ